MKVNLDGRVKNLDLPVSKPLLPLLEAISNSIHAIEDAEEMSGKITIRVLRGTCNQKLDMGDDSRALDPIVGFEIQDNGVGFTPDNYLSFETCDTRHKVARGAKGVGRLLWLKAFAKIHIRSAFRNGTEMKIRNFSFSLPEGVIEPKVDSAKSALAAGTTIHLDGWADDYSKACPKKAGTIADYLLNHLILIFLNPQAPSMELLDEAEDEPISLNARFRERFQSDGRSDDIIIGEHHFTLHHFHLSTPDNDRHRLQLVAAFREVLEIKLGDRYPALRSKLLNESQVPFTYLGILTGDLLDRRVNQNRSGFDLAKEGELARSGEPRQPEIEQAALSATLGKLQPFLQGIRNRTTERVRSVIHEKFPEYRPLMPQIEEKIDEFSPTGSESEYLRRINEIQLDEEIATRNERDTLRKGNVQTTEDYRARYSAFLKRVTRESETRLAQYVTHRRAILDVLEERLKKRSDDKYPLEEEIHELIFPLKSTSDDSGAWGHQNLWLVDERLAYHYWLASDKPFKSQAVIESVSEDRPDLLIMNRPGVFTGEDSPEVILNSVTLVELKRPGRSSKGSDPRNPLEQLFDYVGTIRANKVKDSCGRQIRVNDATAFFAYLICDVDAGSEFEKMTRNFGLEPTPDGLGFFAFNKPLNTYVEVITFDKLVHDARRRNRVLFRKLGIEVDLGKSELNTELDQLRTNSEALIGTPLEPTIGEK